MVAEVQVAAPSGEVVVEAWSHTSNRNPFRPWVSEDHWAFKAGEDWRIVRDDASVVAFRIHPGHHLMFPGCEFVATTEGGRKTRTRGTLTPDGDEPVDLVMKGHRIVAYRTPDHRQDPPPPMDIDNW